MVVCAPEQHWTLMRDLLQIAPRVSFEVPSSIV